MLFRLPKLGFDPLEDPMRYEFLEESILSKSIFGTTIRHSNHDLKFLLLLLLFGKHRLRQYSGQGCSMKSKHNDSYLLFKLFN